MSDILLDVKDLVIHYETDDGLVQALNGVSLQIHTGKTLGLVGETGAGKTTLAKGIMQLVPNPPGKIKGGEVFYDGEDLLKKSVQEMRKVRGKQISMIFQDPMTSLNPVMTVRDRLWRLFCSIISFPRKRLSKKRMRCWSWSVSPQPAAENIPISFPAV